MKKNLSWEPEIYLKSTHFYTPVTSDNNDTNTICVMDQGNNCHTEFVNLALFLNESVYHSVTLSSFRCNVLKYLPYAVLELEDFKGLMDEKNVVGT
jgi:hypothetical protein